MTEITKATLWRVSALTCVLLLAACATAERKPLVATETTSRPRPGNTTPASLGSLFPVAATISAGYRPLFEDRRARAVGDTLTVVLNESTSANRKSGANVERKGSAEAAVTGINTVPLLKKVPIVKDLEGMDVTGSAGIKSEGKGSASAANDFSGTITVTVMEVLSNGNLIVAGEKQLAVSAEEEIIRFSGVVNPSDLVNNTVTSAKVADARMEYRGRGAGDDAQNPGWLTRAMLKISPF